MKSKRLGKGLEALIPQITPEDDEKRKESLAEVATDKVRPNPFQPRVDFDRKGLDELKQSIIENGVIQPITVRRVDEEFELIAGERRLRAVQELGIPSIPAFVMEIDSNDQMLELALVENIQREDLNPIEQARAFKRLQSEYGFTQEVVANKVGKDRATVANILRLLKLPEAIQKSLQKNEISMGHAKALMGLRSPGEQLQTWRKIIKQGWNVRKVEEVVQIEQNSNGKTKKTNQPKKPAYLIELEEKLRSLMGTQVKMKRSGKGGKIEISFFSDEDLERLLELLYTIAES